VDSLFLQKIHKSFFVPDIQKFFPYQTIERLCYALVCFKDWDYGVWGWNCEHLARLVASDSAVSLDGFRTKWISTQRYP
jgi:hypothetical protein